MIVSFHRSSSSFCRFRVLLQIPKGCTWGLCGCCTLPAIFSLLLIEVLGRYGNIVSEIVFPIKVLALFVWFIRCSIHSASSTGQEMETKNLPSSEEVMALIKSRRSVFCNDMDPEVSVPQEYIEGMLEAANWAPSHGRSNPWHFVVFTDASKIHELKQISLSCIQNAKGTTYVSKFQSDFDENVRWMRAKALIAIVMKRCSPQQRRNPEWEEIAACGCAVQNMHLYVTSLPNICGYWSSWYESARKASAMKIFLGVSEDDQILGFFIVGASISKRTRYESFRSKVSSEWRWRPSIRRTNTVCESGAASLGMIPEICLLNIYQADPWSHNYVWYMWESHESPNPASIHNKWKRHQGDEKCSPRSQWWFTQVQVKLFHCMWIARDWTEDVLNGFSGVKQEERTIPMDFAIIPK